jgi:hypothetical protein
MLRATCMTAKLSSCARKLGSSIIRNSFARSSGVCDHSTGSLRVALYSIASRAPRSSTSEVRSASGLASSASSRSAPRSSASAAASFTSHVARPALPMTGCAFDCATAFSQFSSSTSRTIVLAGVLRLVGR